MLTTESRLRDFPSLREMAYFNTAAEGVSPLAVRDAYLEYFEHKQRGMDGRGPHFAALDETKALVARFYGLTTDEVAICSCSSEAYNLAAMALRLREGDEVVVNDLDFPAGVTPWLQKESPATVKVWRSRNGALQTEDLIPLLSPKTRLVTTSLVSFYNGYRLPLAPVREAVRRHSPALFSVDVTQALGRIPLELDDVDLIVSSTHKWILASHGGGLVGVRSQRAAELTAPAGGWYHLQDAFGANRFDEAVSRPGAASFAVGMPNFPAIYAIRAGLRYIEATGVDAIDAHARPLTEGLLHEIKSLPVELLTPTDAPPAGIIAFRHPKADEIHRQLLAEQIHVMSHAGRLRIAVHGYNTPADVDRLLRTLTVALRSV